MPVVATSYAVLLPATLGLDNPARRIVGALLLACLILHCLARPAGGGRILALAGVTCATCTILDDIIALPRWTGLLFCPFALVLAWYEDHSDGQDLAAPGS